MASERRRRQIARRIQQRVAELLLYEIKDPRAALVTVTGVEMNQDLSVARIRYSVYGHEGERRRVQAMLDHARGFLRTEVAKAVRLRNAPQLVFDFDEGALRVERLERILREVRRPAEEETREAAPAPPETEDDGA